jgi:hypothetical protein
MTRLALLLAILAAVLSGCGVSYDGPTQKGSYHLRSGHYDEAIVALSEGIAQDPRDVEAHLNRGKAYQYRGAQGDLDRAIDDFTEVIRLAPNDPDAYSNRSMAYRDRKQEGDAERSQEDDTMMRKLDPRYQELENQLSETRRPVTIRAIPAPEEASEPASNSATKDSANDSTKKESSLDDVFEGRARSNLDDYVRRKAEEKKGNDEREAAASTTKPRARDDDNRLREMQLQRVRNKAEQAAQSAPRLSEPDAAGIREGSADPSERATRRALPRPGEIGSQATGRDRFTGRSAQPTIPQSPWQQSPWQRSAGPVSGLPDQSPYRSGYQSPFPQRAPRPTGQVDNGLPTVPNATQPRQLSPSQLPPPARPAGADPDDFR